jgi:hypothetical protein
VAISHIYKDACRLAQAKGLARLIYHEPALEVRFVRKAMGETSFLTIRDFNPPEQRTAQHALPCSRQITQNRIFSQRAPAASARGSANTRQWRGLRPAAQARNLLPVQIRKARRGGKLRHKGQQPHS